MSDVYSPYYLFAADGSAKGTLGFSDPPSVLGVNRVDGIGVEYDQLNVNIPVKSIFLISDTKGNQLELEYVTGLIVVSGDNQVQIPVSVKSQTGILVLGELLFFRVNLGKNINTLTNVLISAPILGDFLRFDSLGNVLNESLPLPSSAIVGVSDAQTLTNKTIDAASNTISNISLTGDVTGILPLNSGGTNSTALQLLNGTIVCSDAGSLKGLKLTPAGAVVGDTDAQTLTNKTLTAPSNACRAVQLYEVTVPSAAPIADQKLKTDGAASSQWVTDNLDSINDVELGTGAFMPITGDQLTYLSGTGWINLTNILGSIGYYDTPFTTLIGTQNVYTKLAGTYALDPASFQFTLSGGAAPANSIRCIDGFSWTCRVDYQVSLDTATNNRDVGLAIYRNGVIEPTSVSRATTANTGRQTSLGGYCWTTMTNGDYLEIFVRNISDTSNITSSQAKIFVAGLRLV